MDLYYYASESWGVDPGGRSCGKSLDANVRHWGDSMKIDNAINLAIENILKEGLTDVEVFARPFEVDLLKNQDILDDVKANIKTTLKESQIKGMGFTPISHILVPKKELFDFRKCAIIEPVDEARYLSLVLQIADLIEVKRPNKSKNNVFSYRFHPSKGYLFDQKYNYTSFREHVSRKSRQRNVNVVVSCDISNFYDRLNLHRLECILSSNPKIDKKIILQINELLLFWSGRDSYGIPVGSNASRILAEAALIEVDNFLTSHKISYCRFVDDFKLFAPDAATAHRWLALLVDRLSKEGLFLNTGKTQIKDVSVVAEPEPEPEAEADADAAEVPEADAQGEDETAKSSDPVPGRNRDEVARIIRGYSGLIPTKFRALTASELNRLREEDISDRLGKISSSVLIDPTNLVALVKACVAKSDPVVLMEVVKNLNKFPQFIPYVIDAIIKNEGIFGDSHVDELSGYLSYWLDRDHAPEFVSIFVIRFFGHGRFKSKSMLMECFRRLRRNDGSYIGRALLEQLEPIVERGEVIEIRDYFVRADQSERRQISKMVHIHLTKGEKRPFFKNSLSQSQDIFLRHMENLF
ncbi:RNA-directed DNA polymerase [Burkholderia gladioli]|uniref:RNA-directed DNA polymerase n=1 Tax=Burkholderia gladioli TaxID=28095 RepID=UPI001C24C2E8|nr:RNA-directed DNA polymerase [Burkholderia gladioli]MBU9645303.1 RNA-directed DNA polymerase [Burkholderia gladioli]